MRKCQKRKGRMSCAFRFLFAKTVNMSLIMRKPAFYIRENKAPDQLLCFRYIDCTIPLLPKSKILCSTVCVRPGLNPRDMFSHDTVYIVFSFFQQNKFQALSHFGFTAWFVSEGGNCGDRFSHNQAHIYFVSSSALLIM